MACSISGPRAGSSPGSTLPAPPMGDQRTLLGFAAHYEEPVARPFVNTDEFRPQLRAALEYAQAHAREFKEAVTQISHEHARLDPPLFRPTDGGVKTWESAWEKACRYGGNPTHPELVINDKNKRPFVGVFNDIWGATFLVKGGAKVLAELSEQYKNGMQVGGTPFYMIVRPQREISSAYFTTLEYRDPNNSNIRIRGELQFFAEACHKSMKMFHELAKIPSSERPKEWAQYKAIMTLVALAKDNGLPTGVPVQDLINAAPPELRNPLQEEINKLEASRKRESLNSLVQLETPQLCKFFGSAFNFLAGNRRHESDPVPLEYLRAMLQHIPKNRPLGESTP